MSTPVQKLERDAAYSLLERIHTGHVGCWNASGDHVYIVPVNFVLVGDAIYFYAEPGRKTSYMRAHPRGVCFQVDEVGPDAWSSVLVYGRYGEVLDPAERTRVTAALVAKYGLELLDPVFARAEGNPLAIPQEAARLIGDTVLGYIYIERISGRSR
jgi:nitroimidazol reductase NimA-like FMN-containing flavoprotein (pyridoxamine 5'-phosphate oxidase superfamily)